MDKSNKIITHQQLSKQLFNDNHNIRQIKEIFNQRGLKISEKVIRDWVQENESNFKIDEYLKNNLSFKNIQFLYEIQSFISVKFKNIITEENQQRYLNVLILQALVANGMISVDKNPQKEKYFDEYTPFFQFGFLDDTYKDLLINATASVVRDITLDDLIEKSLSMHIKKQIPETDIIEKYDQHKWLFLQYERATLVFFLRLKNMTLQSIGKYMKTPLAPNGVSRERIRQIQGKEIKRLKAFHDNSSTYLKILKTIEDQILEIVRINEDYITVDSFLTPFPNSYIKGFIDRDVFLLLLNVINVSFESKLNFIELKIIKHPKDFKFINPISISTYNLEIENEEINTFLNDKIFFSEYELQNKFNSKIYFNLLKVYGKIDILEIPKEIKNITGQIAISNSFPMNARYAIKSILISHFENVYKTSEFSSRSDYLTCIEGIHFKDFSKKAKEFLPDTSVRAILQGLERYKPHGFILGKTHVGHLLLRTEIINIKNSDNLANTIKKILDENTILGEDAFLYKLWELSPNLNYKSFYITMNTMKSTYTSIDDEQGKLWKFHEDHSEKMTYLPAGNLLTLLKHMLSDKYMTVSEIIKDAKSKNYHLNESSVRSTLESRHLTFFNERDKYKYNHNSEAISVSDITDEQYYIIIDYYLEILRKKLIDSDFIMPTQNSMANFINTKGVLLNKLDFAFVFRNISNSLEKLDYENLLTSSSVIESKKITKLIKIKLN